MKAFAAKLIKNTKQSSNLFLFNKNSVLISSFNRQLIKHSYKNYFNYPCPRKLRELVKMSAFEKETTTDIKKIWTTYHDEKPRTFADVVDGELMKKICSNAMSNNMFLFPVKRSEGFFNVILQNQEKSFIYTFLEDFKKSPETATPYLVITLFDELLFSKGVILVRGDIIGDLSTRDSQILLQMTKDFYSIEHLFKKVVDFNKNSRKFDFNEHLNHCLGTYFNENESEIIPEKEVVRQPKMKPTKSIYEHGANPTLTTFGFDKKK